MIGGVRQKIHFFCMDLPQSDACFVKGFVDAVAILCGGKEVARHARSYAEGAFVADPLHYLALIEINPNALDQAAALQGWDLPEVFQHLRHLLEARMGNRGKHEFILGRCG